MVSEYKSSASFIWFVHTSRVLWYLSKSSWTPFCTICANLPRDSSRRLFGPQILINCAQPYLPPGIAFWQSPCVGESGTFNNCFLFVLYLFAATWTLLVAYISRPLSFKSSFFLVRAFEIDEHHFDDEPASCCSGFSSSYWSYSIWDSSSS